MDTDKKTIVLLTPGFPKDETDTTCLPFIQTHLKALNKRFPDTEVIILAFQYPFTAGKYEWYGNKVISFGGRSRPKLHRLLIWLKVWNKLRQLNREKKIMALFSLWCTECALIGHYFGKRHQIKHFTWLCGQDAQKDNKYVKYIHPVGQELIAMSDFLKREFYQHHGVLPAVVVPLGVNEDEFSNENYLRTIDVLGAGSLIPLKQYDLFVTVINRLKDSIPGINAILCGDGPERSKIEQQMAISGLQNVTLKGEVPHAAVLQMMKQAKIFLHTSRYEGLGTVCIEALYAGAHVVSFTKPMDGTIPHWHHVNNIDEMVIKVKELLSDPTTEYYSITAYKAEDIATTLMELFNG